MHGDYPTMKTNFNMSAMDWLALVIVFIGALNWGLIGLAHFLTDAGNWNLVNQIFGGSPAAEFGIYLLVGLAALWTIYFGGKAAGFVKPMGTSDRSTEPKPQD